MADIESQEDFVAGYAARSGMSVTQLLTRFRPERCDCEADICTGWRMEPHDLEPPARRAGPGLAYLEHTVGCLNDRHNPATTLCTNELIWNWTT